MRVDESAAVTAGSLPCSACRAEARALKGWGWVPVRLGCLLTPSLSEGGGVGRGALGSEVSRLEPSFTR